MGPNGSGKSSLIFAILGHPDYRIKKGPVFFKGKDVTSTPTEERAELGLGVSFQLPPKIRGVTLRALARRLLPEKGKDGEVDRAASLLNLKGFLDRDIHAGFSGGETKRAEPFFLLLQRPILSLIDEPDDADIDTDEKKALARIACNFVRREVPQAEKRDMLGNLAKIGWDAKKIAEETGIPLRTVYEYLPAEAKKRIGPKGPRKEIVAPAISSR